MSDDAPLALDRLSLPPSVVSKADVARLGVELERIDNDLSTNTVRTKVGAATQDVPPMSRQLADFVLENKLDINVATLRTQLIKQVNNMKDTLPIIHMTLREQSQAIAGRMTLWLRQEVHPQAVIDVGLQPGLVAGVYVRTANRVFDLSLKGALSGSRDILTNELRSLYGRTKVFEKLVTAGNPVGEIIGIDSFMVSVKASSQPTCTLPYDSTMTLGATLHQVFEDHVIVMKLDPSPLHIGGVCVIEGRDIMTPVGKNFIGRVVNVFGEPIDGKGEIVADQEWRMYFTRRRCSMSVNCWISQ